jgi:hypothetical protein
MLCKIAELIVNVPEAGDLVPRCKDYLFITADEKIGADITIRTDLFETDDMKGLTENDWIYVISGSNFLFELLKFNGMMLHASAVEIDGKAYLFSAPCGTGKSTHTRLWQTVFGDRARVFNDDKPALRYLDGKWYAYGTPWCGKDGININMKAPVAGICFLKQASENRIRRLGSAESIQKIISQTLHRFKKIESIDLMLGHVESIVKSIPVFELENRPEPDAARLSYETMRRAAEENGL